MAAELALREGHFLAGIITCIGEYQALENVGIWNEPLAHEPETCGCRKTLVGLFFGAEVIDRACVRPRARSAIDQGRSVECKDVFQLSDIFL